MRPSVELHNYFADINYLDYVWRIMIGFGCIPAVLTIYFR